MILERIAPIVMALVLAPLLPGLINRTKAMFAGRSGPPFLQAYFDLHRLMRKGAVYSLATTPIFRLGPAVTLAGVIAALFLLPFGGARPLVSFSGDVILLAGFLAAGRFLTMLAALDTGSAFEGMGASREAIFSALAEPALLVGFVALARLEGGLSVSDLLWNGHAGGWAAATPVLALVAGAIAVVTLVENARIPVDDPGTHLELTMVHEVMVLDHSGPDFAYITYAQSLRLWVLGSILLGVIVPIAGNAPAWTGLAIAGGALAGLALIVGTIESAMARLRLLAVPKFILAAVGLSLLAVMVSLV